MSELNPKPLNLRPLADRVIVELVEEDEITPGGIILPEIARGKSQRGAILAVGPGKRDDRGEVIPMNVVVGDIVLYTKYGGTEVKLGTGQEILILREGDILAVVDR